MTHRCSPLLKTCLIPALLFSMTTGQVNADEPATDKAKRPEISNQRPDLTRGWMVVSKANYWPLCYESLDRIEEARELIGSKNDEEVAKALEKCGAWLNLAASAAMTDGESGVADVGAYFDDAADAVRNGSSWSKEELENLTTLGLLAMTKSHLLRAEAADRHYKAPRPKTTTGELSKEQKAIAREIAVQSRERDMAQYRYDAVESQRHLTAAQTYLQAAAEAGGFEIDEALTQAVPELPTGEKVDEAGYVDDELRPRIASMNKLVSARHAELNKKLAHKL